MTKRYRLGLDLGSNSLGWWTVWLDDKGRPVGLGPGGVRIFPDGRDPKSEASNAQQRRVARGLRRRRDRYLLRRDDLIAALVDFGLMPADAAERRALVSLDPYELRAKGLDAPLPPHHLGRALFHLHQRRGFKSNRKSDAKNNEKGAIKEATRRLDEEMRAAGARTLGEFLWRRHARRAPVRVRNRAVGTKVVYDFYPTRVLVEAEFDLLWSSQAASNPKLTNAARERLRAILFRQRPLRTPPVGKCTFEPAQSPDDLGGFRAPLALPLAQRFRIVQEVQALEVLHGVQPENLSKEQGDKLVLALLQRKTLSFDAMRGLLGLAEDVRFNLESDKRSLLKGDETAGRLAHRDLFGKAWRGLGLARQTEIVERLLDEAQADEQVLGWLQEGCGLDAERARRVLDCPLPEGHSRLGRRALAKIVPLMEEQNLRYWDAATRIYGDHAQLPTGELAADGHLPYYGEWLQNEVVGTGDPAHPLERRYGRIANPSVHIGLNQLRRVVNALIDELRAPPGQIVVELARDLKMSPEAKRELLARQKEDQERNERRDAQLREHRIEPNGRDRMKLRLWEELNPKDHLDRRCPFTGEPIGRARLLSEDVEIEHLIPFALCWDDSAANKVVCLRKANRAKRRQTPFEAFGTSPLLEGHQYDWQAILARAQGLPHGKRWRFQPDAHEHFARVGGFQARQLNETRWLSRIAKSYLHAICNPNSVWVIPGQLTALLRRKWSLNPLLPDHNFSTAKNRADHRHHAVDALVTAMTDRALLQRLAREYDEERERIVIAEPWAGFRDQVKAALDAIVVSYKPDHGPEGGLHEETAYGRVKEPEKEDGNLVYRKNFLDLNDNEIGRIRDRRLRDKVRAFVDAQVGAGRKLREALEAYAARRDDPHTKEGLRHIRLLKTEQDEYLVPVPDGNGRPYKAYSAGENLYIEVFETADGRWHGQAVTRFQANRRGHRAPWREKHPDSKLVMRVYKGDLIELEHEGCRQVMVARRLDARAGRFKLSGHAETGNLDERHARPNDVDPFRWLMASYNTLKERGARRVELTPTGRVRRARDKRVPWSAASSR